VQPFGVDFSPDGKTMYFVEMVGGERFRCVDEKGIVRTLAGTGAKGSAGDGMSGPKASFNGMHSLAVGSDGIVYLADTLNHRIRTYDPKTKVVSAFAGTGEKAFDGDGGLADFAKFGDTFCLAFDEKKENLYVADLDNRRIRKINLKTKTVTTAAGNGTNGVPKDGTAAINSPLVDPRAVAVAGDGAVFIVERSGHALRMADEGGKIYTLAGTGTAGTDLGDGAATQAMFNGPKHLCIEHRDTGYNVLIADTENHRILRYTPGAGGGRVTVVAGSGKKGSKIADKGDPLKSELAQPHGVAIHPKTGEIYIADSSNGRILKIGK
jgi:sugar lactone lactonase YvrE